MSKGILFYAGIIVLLAIGCTPVEKIAFHDLSSGYYKLKTPENQPSKVYVNVYDDSITVYKTIEEGRRYRLIHRPAEGPASLP